MAHDNGTATGSKALDPVCGMTVDPATALSAEHDGTRYYFCCEACRTKFITDPEKYLNAKPFVLPPRKTAAAQGPAGHDHMGHDHSGHHHPHPPAAPVPLPMEGGALGLRGRRRPQQAGVGGWPTARSQP